VKALRRALPGLAWGCWLVSGLPPAASAATVDYQLTPTHSFVHFEWQHAGLSTLRGRFDKVSGRVSLDRDARQGRGLIELKLESVNTGRPALDAAIRDGLGATDAVPARFEIETMTFAGAVPTAVIGHLRGGRLDLPFRLKADHFNCYFNPLLRREVCGGEFSAQVDPSALGLDLAAAFGMSGPVQLRVQVEAIRQEGTP
jgi:polyisoprenoid-binding protein YceI